MTNFLYHIPLFDETLRHRKLCNSVISEIRQNFSTVTVCPSTGTKGKQNLQGSRHILSRLGFFYSYQTPAQDSKMLLNRYFLDRCITFYLCVGNVDAPNVWKPEWMTRADGSGGRYNRVTTQYSVHYTVNNFFCTVLESVQCTLYSQHICFFWMYIF